MKFTTFPFIRYLISFVIGVVFYAQYTLFYGEIYWILGGLFFLFFGLNFYKKSSKNLVQGILSALIFFLFGWVISYQQTPINHKSHYLNKLQSSYYQAVIISNTEIKPKTYKVEAEIKTIRIDSTWQKTTGKVLLYFNKSESSRPAYGDVFLIKGSPREVEPPKNPQEFNYQVFLQRKGIYVHHFLRKNDFLKLGNQPQNAVMNLAIHANIYADTLFKTNIKTKNEYAIANAMIVGLRDDVDNDLLQAYSASGAIHVLSVSGMHVAILFIMLRFIFGRIKRLKHGIIIFNLLIISLLWVYAIFTGLSSTVLRATVMFTFVQVAEMLNRRSSIYNTLAMSAFCLLCWNPFWVFDVGFQLSYLAIIGIVYLHPLMNQLISPKHKISRVLWEISSVSFSAQLATFPLSIYYFHQFPTYFLLANPFVFLFSEGILPFGLALLIFGQLSFLAKIISFWLKLTLWLLNQSLFLIEKIPFSTLKGFSISLTETLLIYALFILIVLFFRRKEIRYLQVGFMLLVGLVSWNILEDFRESKQQLLTIHFIPKKSGISLINGKNSTFLADSILLKNPKIYDFHLKNYYDYQGVSHKNFVDVSEKESEILDFNNQKIMWLRKPFYGEISEKIDYLIISNNALKTLPKSSIKNIIVDDSNKRYVIENLAKQADSLHINFSSVYDKGAITLR